MSDRRDPADASDGHGSTNASDRRDSTNASDRRGSMHASDRRSPHVNSRLVTAFKIIGVVFAVLLIVYML